MRFAWCPVSRNLVVCAVLLAGTLLYLSRWPHDLYGLDEGLFLYEAKRIRDGEIPYRDFFEIVTPGAWYAMALLFRLFGTTMETARNAMAVVHALIVGAVFLACRARRVHLGLAVAAAVSHLGICYPAFPIATPHWLSTLLTLALLLLFLVGRWTGRVGWWVVPGVVTGLLILVQQQKGLVLALGPLALLAGEALLEWRRGVPLGRAARGLGWYMIGAAAIVVPPLGVLLVAAGMQPVVTDLIVQPLFYYRSFNRSTWGANQVAAFLQALRLPVGADVRGLSLLAYLPAIVAIALAVAWLRRGTRSRDDDRGVAGLAAMLVLCPVASLSVIYNPDVIHLALIAPVFFVLAADTLEELLRLLPGPAAAGRVVGWGLAVTLLALLVLKLDWQLDARCRAYSLSRMTAFGRVDFFNAEEVAVLDKLTELLRQEPPGETFAYPYYASLYLLTDTRNPTPYQLLIPGYSLPGQLEDAIDTLERRRVRYVVVWFPLWPWASDPVIAYLERKYERVDYGVRRPFPTVVLYRRRADNGQPLRRNSVS